MGDINPAAVQAAGGYAGTKLDNPNTEWGRAADTMPPGPEDLVIHIKAQLGMNSVDYARWMGFKAAAYAKVVAEMEKAGYVPRQTKT
jgi:hypothetical protein